MIQLLIKNIEEMKFSGIKTQVPYLFLEPDGHTNVSRKFQVVIGKIK